MSVARNAKAIISQRRLSAARVLPGLCNKLSLMQPFLRGVFIMSLAIGSAWCASPVVGRWDFNLPGSGSLRANWLGVSEKNGSYEVLHQPSGGHVRPVASAKVTGNHLSLVVAAATDKAPATTWELDAVGDKLTGVQKR